MQVPLTLQRALGLQAELYIRLSTRRFQRVLSEYKERFGEATPEFRKLRQLLVLGVQKEVLPKYGYPGTLEGVAHMRKAFEELKDPQVKSNTEVISHLIGGSLEDVLWISDHGTEVADLEHLSHELAPQREHPVEQQLDFSKLSAPMRPPALDGDFNATAPYTGIGVELDVNDIQVPLTKERALALQKELLTGFQAQAFQDQLRALEARYPGDRDHQVEFRRERQQLALTVQARVLPKYGYPGTLEGVARMIQEFREKFHGDPDIDGNIQAIDHLLLSTSRNSSPVGGRVTEPDAKARLTPRRGKLFRHVTEKEGFWVVVGGTKSGGIVSRVGDDPHSHAWPDLLATGAVIKQVARVGDKVCYEKVLGDGPNTGWVTVKVKDHDLLAPYRGEVPDLRGSA